MKRIWRCVFGFRRLCKAVNAAVETNGETQRRARLLQEQVLDELDRQRARRKRPPSASRAAAR